MTGFEIFFFIASIIILVSLTPLSIIVPHYNVAKSHEVKSGKRSEKYLGRDTLEKIHSKMAGRDVTLDYTHGKKQIASKALTVSDVRKYSYEIGEKGDVAPAGTDKVIAAAVLALADNNSLSEQVDSLNLSGSYRDESRDFHPSSQNSSFVSRLLQTVSRPTAEQAPNPETKRVTSGVSKNQDLDVNDLSNLDVSGVVETVFADVDDEYLLKTLLDRSREHFDNDLFNVVLEGDEAKILSYYFFGFSEHVRNSAHRMVSLSSARSRALRGIESEQSARKELW